MRSAFKVITPFNNGAFSATSRSMLQEAVPEPLLTAVRDSSVCARIPPARAGIPESIFYGSSERMRNVWRLADKISASDVPIVIQGQTGTGKEVLARYLHGNSKRAAMPFLKVNCAAIPAELMESELFGYERGAFTGAFQRKPGLFELADGGTLFLDEIGDMDLKLQSKLLQVLQDHEFRRLGGKEAIRVDVRIISATHRDLASAIRQGSFREDLYYRLSVFTVYLPALCERKEDLSSMVDFLISRHSTDRYDVPQVNSFLKKAIHAYQWPGNVRELENVVQRLIVLNDPDLIARELLASVNSPATHEQLPENDNGAKDDLPCDEANHDPCPAIAPLGKLVHCNQQAEKEAILAALHSARWNRKKAASMLRVDYKALLYKMKKLGLAES